ncbi:hypothetical protein TARUN_4407 [Trichoderma arundinaceum]|uniref:PARP catalytic domain-containing protein n=1 Tax=Trichoderma arundinaceum TaxID=490622 RepID=A0A395NPI3_TRIAR|nr:hypothetical protein TARUN_4407 [Trichoderma arundinaceum]
MAFASKLIYKHLPTAVATWSQETSEDLNEETFQFQFSNFTFQLCLSLDHQHYLSSRVLDTHSSIPRRILDPLRQNVRSIFLTLYKEEDESSHVKEGDLQVAILQALEHLSEYREEGKYQAGAKKTASISNKGFSASEISSWEDVVSNPIGLDVSTIRDTASFLLGMTPEQIAGQIPKVWRIIHMESIIREDLLKRFTRYQTRLREFLPNQPNLRKKLPPHSSLDGRYRSTLSMEDVVEDMVKPRVTFHGTSLRSVRSIIRNGLLLPGQLIDGKRVESPRSGIAFNRGIYSSQSASYAMSYASGQQELTPLGALPSMRLFVCATVMGRTYVDKPGSKLGSVHGPLIDGFESHFDGKFEYITYEPRAILPCFVIHLDLGSEAALQAVRAAQLNPSAALQEDTSANKQTTPGASRHQHVQDESAGDRKRRQLALKAAAMKWFPYGFGTATGTSFVIEDIGEVSEDEEDFGVWQAERHAYEPKDDWLGSRGPESLGWDEEEGSMDKGLFLDSYQREREVRVQRSKNDDRKTD